MRLFFVLDLLNSVIFAYSLHRRDSRAAPLLLLNCARVFASLDVSLSPSDSAATLVCLSVALILRVAGFRALTCFASSSLTLLLLLCLLHPLQLASLLSSHLLPGRKASGYDQDIMTSRFLRARQRQHMRLDSAMSFRRQLVSDVDDHLLVIHSGHTVFIGMLPDRMGPVVRV